MGKGRLEAFSDGVLAIIITIMVLEMKVPHGASLENLTPLLPVFLSYILSFIYVGIYWNNHHHFLHAVKQVNGKVLWANMYLLFWLSLFPFATAWMGENHFEALPVALYGFVLLMAALAWMPFHYAIVAANGGKTSVLAKAVGFNNWKANVALVIYAISIPMAFVSTWISGIGYLAVTIIWLVPETRIENALKSGE